MPFLGESMPGFLALLALGLLGLLVAALLRVRAGLAQMENVLAASFPDGRASGEAVAPDAANGQPPQPGSASTLSRPRTITGRVKRIEAQVRSLERTRRTLEFERDSARSRVEAQHREQSQFFARISHELRTPINAIMGYTTLVQEQVALAALPDVQDDLQKIRHAGSDLLTLIDNLLDIGGARPGTVSPARRQFDVGELFEELVEQRLAHGSGVVLSVPSGQPMPKIFGSRENIARTLNALLDNVDRQQKGATVRLTHAAGEDRGSLTILVEVDYARAGSPEMDADTADSVGVKVASLFAKASGGTLSHTRLGPGHSRWAFTVPHNLNQERQSTMPEYSGTAKAVTDRPPGASKKALVIDDDPAAVELLGRWLSRCGYDMVSAHDADTGVRVAAEAQPDIVLLDALMPGKTGYEVLPELRALPGLANTPILIVTVDDDRARGLQAGASDFVRKPVTEQALRSIISVYDRDQSGDVLIIEDDDDAAELLKRTVARLGFTTRRATNGTEGLDAVEQSAPTAILLDLNMPRLNGFDFIEKLVADERFAAIPLIVVSGHDLSVAQHQRLLAAGARFYLKGNAAPREIAAGLREALV